MQVYKGMAQMCADPEPQFKIVSSYYGLCYRIIRSLFINVFKNIYIYIKDFIR